jgi:phosphatidylcholine synthase
MAEPKQRSALPAWAVHVFSASGAVLALFAVVAIFDHRWTDAMLWLFAALVVDGVDGTLARAAGTKELTPRIDGDALDLVIDYLNYVFVPTLFLLEAQLLSATLAMPLAALIQLSSLYVFARRDMKTEDSYFRGFPALWNVVVLYLYATHIDRSLAAAIVGALIVLSFAPIHFVHPFRVRDYGRWLPATAIIWCVSTLALIFDQAGETRLILLAVSSVSAVAIVALGLVRTARGRRQDSITPVSSPKALDNY